MKLLQLNQQLLYLQFHLIDAILCMNNYLILLDLFYKIFLFPIEWLMKVILEALYALTDNYGLSIIFLSILINILTLPFYYVAEHLKIQHKKKIEALKPKIDLLKK